MMNIGNSNNLNRPSSSTSGQAPIDEANDVLIHVMPQQFRSGGAGPNAKSAGIFIIIGAILLFIVGGAAFYFLVWEKTAVKPAPVASPVKPTVVKPTPLGDQKSVVKSVYEQVSTTSPLVATTSVVVATTSIVQPELNNETELRVAVDTDRDGLSDDEEVLLGTEVSAQDSDGDGFGDLVELQRGYDPAGPGKLISNSKLKLYEQVKYSLTYPAIWNLKVTDGDYAVVWQAPDNQLVQLNMEKISTPTTAEDWYKQRFNVTEIPAGRTIEGKTETGATSWVGVKSSDGLVVYVMNRTNTELYTLSYNPGVDSVAKYLNIFQVMVNSFGLK